MNRYEIKTIIKSIRAIKDFPKKGVVFRDISTLVSDPTAFECAVEAMDESVEDVPFDKIAAVESRGFVFGSVMAYNNGASLVMVRKAGKLPGDTVRQEYQLEYGTDSIEVTKESFSPGDRVVIVDDLMATGGTLEATAELVEKCGAEVVGIVVLIELEGLGGRERLSKWNVKSVVKFSEENS